MDDMCLVLQRRKKHGGLRAAALPAVSQTDNYIVLGGKKTKTGSPLNEFLIHLKQKEKRRVTTGA